MFIPDTIHVILAPHFPLSLPNSPSKPTHSHTVASKSPLLLFHVPQKTRLILNEAPKEKKQSDMGPQEPSITSSNDSSSSSCSASRTPPDQIDQLLAGAGYVVRSSELSQVAHRLEHLETVMGEQDLMGFPQHLANGVVYYNPSDLSSWVDTLLTELNCQQPNSTLAVQIPVDSGVGSAGWSTETPPPPPPQPEVLSHVLHALDQEDSSIHLVHVLLTCAESVQSGNFSLAGNLIEELRVLLTRVNTLSGIGKVAGYFIDALSRRIYMAQGLSSMDSAVENEIFYHCFYEAAPYLKFAHFTANQAILEAFQGHDSVHVIDFNLMQGLQWPALIQALALRPGGPPLLRITGIGPPSPDGRDSLREIGLKLAGLARSVNVKFAFRGVAASRLDDIKPWMLEASPNEAIAVNSIFQFHKLLGPDSLHGSSIESVLSWIRSLNPKIITVVEQEANHNKAEFLDRFTEALYYYSTMFDSLDACATQPEKALAEMYLQREICNVVCCEGSARVERHEPLAKWRTRLTGAGFKPLHLGSNAFKQASMLLTLFSAEGYCVEENEGCLTLGWHNRQLIAASAWQPVPAEPVPAI
ncbi:OLC1v1037186C1 [Oldenlandia corymbosa var. corymbosa]|uniref:DELLA protein n=1 Tax=Oldenlandia corymbosa var. corymbosa TaxID=529605 RepID=A0AAV1CXU1_OLDCO|nr:OLC1v1037186C1 [Oldenlandia corymbosa var. corymbosa]